MNARTIDTRTRTSPHHCRVALWLLATALLLTACGGHDDIDDGLPVQGPGIYPDCPEDPATFVGPLLPQCLQPMRDQRRDTQPVRCADGRPCAASFPTLG